MSEAAAGGSGGPGWLFSVGAFVCLVGPFAFGRGEDMRFQVRLLTEYLSVPFALTSGFLALSTRKPRCGGAALGLAALLWLGADHGNRLKLGPEQRLPRSYSAVEP